MWASRTSPKMSLPQIPVFRLLQSPTIHCGGSLCGRQQWWGRGMYFLCAIVYHLNMHIKISVLAGGGLWRRPGCWLQGLDKVDRPTRALLDLSGLSVTNAQAAEIQRLYSELLDFDKRPLIFTLKKLKPTRGRFARMEQYRVGHVGVEAVKRYQYLIPQMRNVKW